MNGDGSFPHRVPEIDLDDARVSGPVVGGQVLDFPTDEVSSPGVPAGTWADEDGETSDAHSAGAHLPGGMVVEFPRGGRGPSTEPSGPEGLPSRDPSAADRTGEPATTPSAAADTPTRPSFLASELLQQDRWPASPLVGVLRAGAIAVGLVGALCMGVAGRLEPRSLPLVMLLVAAAITGAVPVTAVGRGAALTAIGALGAAWIAGVSTVAAHAFFSPLLLACVSLSASTLFFRAAHRDSSLAKVLVATSLVAMTGWLVLSGGLDAMVVDHAGWQAWLRPISRALLGALVLCSALTFLDARGHGGAWVAGIAFLVWLGLDAGAVVAFDLSMSRAETADAIRTTPMLSSIALPCFATFAAVGLGQCWVALSLKLRQRAAS